MLRAFLSLDNSAYIREFCRVSPILGCECDPQPGRITQIRYISNNYRTRGMFCLPLAKCCI